VPNYSLSPTARWRPSECSQLVMQWVALNTLVSKSRLIPRRSPQDLDAVARDWAKPPPDANFSLRIPIDYCSLQAARLVSGPYLYITSDEAWLIGTNGVQGTRVEIVTDAPPPPEEPPPPPVLEMNGTFNLELVPGQVIGLETTVASIDETDMAHM